ncbi:mitochondrial import receptor subunit TOM40-1-like [Camellia sinensis]|uniref:mitochondrial import receptor subunit TOM40-1-like n=1 Tax=Camellia sinensis TaxID=4442 RepID=UPI001035DAD5|nr:mitochondrial import receptor subunit TOM40-1-like [Camellia sinensis]
MQCNQIHNFCLQVATGQVASTGMVAMSYVQKVSEKVSLASEFMYNYMSRDVTASVGYDYILRQIKNLRTFVLLLNIWLLSV